MRVVLALVLGAFLSGIQEPQGSSQGSQPQASGQIGPSAAPPQAAAPVEKSALPAQGAAVPATSQASPATKPAQPPQQTGTLPSSVFKVTSRLVLIDVVVSDGKGQPVADLKANDFEVYENGKPQKLVAFNFQHPPPPDLINKAYKPPALPPGVFTNLRDFNGVVGPPTILLVDALNTQVTDQPYLYRELVKFIDQDDQRRNIAIYTLGRRLRMIQDFTSDPQVLRAAVRKLTAQSSVFTQEQQPFEEEFPGLEAESSDQAVADLAQELKDFEAEQQAFQRDVQVRMTMDAMKELAHNVAGYPGRKNLIWLSGSFPLTIFPDENSNRPFNTVRQYSDELKTTAAVFSANQVAVYPVDARGLTGGSFLPDASQRGASLASARGGMNANRMIRQQSAALNSSHDTMNELAAQTGGHAFYNRNDIDHAIALSVTEGSTYYTLAYYPEDKELNGKFRKIQIKLDRKGLQTHYRKGYFAVETQKAPDEKLARAEFFKALLPEQPLATALPFIVRVTPPEKDAGNLPANSKDEKADKAGDKRDAVIVDFSVVPSALTFEPQGELQHAQVDFVVRAFDSKGKPVGDPQLDTVSTALKPATYKEVMQRGLRYHRAITLQPGKYILKLGVRDELSNQIGTLAARVEVPPKN